MKMDPTRSPTIVGQSVETINAASTANIETTSAANDMENIVGSGRNLLIGILGGMIGILLVIVIICIYSFYRLNKQGNETTRTNEVELKGVQQNIRRIREQDNGERGSDSEEETPPSVEDKYSHDIKRNYVRKKTPQDRTIGEFEDGDV